MNPRQPAPGRTPGRRWQFHQAPTRKPGRCGWVLSRCIWRTKTPPHTRAEDSNHMPADALKCKECKTEYPLEARFVCERCFGPLEVSYTLPDASPAELKRKIQAGPHTMWRYADFLPLAGPARSALPTGWTPLVSWRGLLPSASMTQICGTPVRSLTKTIRLPSGDHAVER